MTDYFKYNVHSQEIELHPMDMLSGFTNISYTYYFANKSNKNMFFDLSTLHNSFFQALLEFPILAGHLVVNKKSGKANIIVDKNNLNIPKYVEIKSALSYEQVKAAGFSWNMLPKSMYSVGTVPKANQQGVLKMANVHVLELSNNSGIVLYVSIPHYVVDGVGYCAFITRWSEICISLCNKRTKADNRSKQMFEFDRCIVDANLPKSRSALNCLTHSLYAKESSLARFIAWLSPEKRGRLLSIVSSLGAIEGHIFYISTKSLDMLRKIVLKSLDVNRIKTMFISDNDVITALATLVIAHGAKNKRFSDSVCVGSKKGIRLRSAFQAAKKIMHLAPQRPEEPANSTDSWTTSIVVDVRCRLKHIKESNYTGNAVFVVPILSKLECMNSSDFEQALADLALAIRSTVSGISGPSIAQIVDIVSKSPHCYAQALANSITNSRKVVVSNQSRFPLYSVDFGLGRPEWISPVPAFYANFVSILPKNTRLDGYHIYVTTSKRTMKHVLSNRIWLEYASLVY